MKNLLSILIAVLVLCGAVSRAADANGRVDTRVLAGAKGNFQDEFTRLSVPIFPPAGTLAYYVTNKSDGIIFPFTNLTTTVYIYLPNPTNNPGRQFTIVPMGSCNVILTNTLNRAFDFTYAFGRTNSTGYTIASNATATVWSTGTNYIGVTR